MATDNLTALTDQFDSLLSKLSASSRRQLSRDIARSLRASQAQRIKQNIAPGGSAYEPRKSSLQQRRGAIKHRLMFQKLIRTKWLTASSTAEVAVVGFVGFANQVAREHHYGLLSRIGQQHTAQMPKRELLGLTQAEQQNVQDIISRYLAL